jgi:hypothetical protein
MKRQLGRRRPEAVAAHPLWQEAQVRMQDRLSYIRQPQGQVLEHGLAQFGQAVGSVVGEVGMIWSVGLLAYLSDPRSTLGFWANTLAPGGLLMFATLGPDTLRPLALALEDGANTRHVPGYPDMHDLGDALVGLSMANPVMDVERINLTYSGAQAALDDIRQLGGNPLLGRPRGLSGRGWKQRVIDALEGLRSGGEISLPVELIFGHAWASLAPKATDAGAKADGPKTVRWLGKQPKNAASGI